MRNKLIDNFLRDEHRKLWTFLAKNPNLYKMDYTDWPRWMRERAPYDERIDAVLKNQCFACFYSCGECPIRTSEGYTCGYTDSFYVQYDIARGVWRIKAARKLRDAWR